MDSSQPLFEDPLTDVTRKTRRTLILFSFVGLMTTKMNFIPTKIENLGIYFTVQNIKEFFYLITSVAIYFLVTFSIYALTDLVKWFLQGRKRHYRIVAEGEKGLVRAAIESNRKGQNKEIGEMHDELNTEISNIVEERIDKIQKRALPLVYLRLLMDIGFPFIFSCYSIFNLLKKI